MTTGTRTIGNGATDFFFTKTWNGSDSPKQKKVKPMGGYWEFYWEYIWDKKGIQRRVQRKKWVLVYPRKSARAKKKDPHPYSMSRVENVQPIYELHQRGFPPATGWIGFRSAQLLFPPSVVTANVTISMVKELANKLRGGSDFDASVFLGTGFQSLRTITNASVRIANALLAVRKGRMTEAAALLTGKSVGPKNRPVKTQLAMSQAWLELRYGWMPLVQDIYDSGQFLSNLLQDPFIFKTSVQRRWPMLPPATSGTGTTATSWSSWNAGEYYRIIGYFKENPSNIYKLGLNNPLNLAWELLPWSFVVDWAIPIGDYLHARGDVSSLVGTFVTTSYMVGSASKPVLNGTQTSTWDAIRSNTNNSGKYAVLNRTVSTTLTVPPPEFKPLNKVATWIHAANAIALLVGVKNKTITSFGNLPSRGN
jgi:hypothetical protein